MSTRVRRRDARLPSGSAPACSGGCECGRAADQFAHPPNTLEDFGFRRGEGESDVAVVAERAARHERDTGLGEQLVAEGVRSFALAREILVDAEEQVERAVRRDVMRM